MTFLSRLLLGKSQAAQLRIRDAYAWHRALWEAFPGEPASRRDFLFRIDDIGRDFRVYVLSERRPQPPVWGHWTTKQIAPSFLEHEWYRFQVRANPTMRRSKDGRRLGLFREDLLQRWMERKAELHGVAVPPQSLVIGGPQEIFFTKDGRRGKLIAVEFEGILQVKDRQRFQDAFTRGIGSGKAFGFGLLVLQPLPAAPPTHRT